MEAHALLAYDHPMIRINRFEFTFNTKNSDALRSLLEKINSKHHVRDNIVVMAQPQGDPTKGFVKVEFGKAPVQNEGKNPSDVVRILESVHGIALTTQESRAVSNSRKPRVEADKIIATRILKRVDILNNKLEVPHTTDDTQHEGLLGHRQVRLDSLKNSLRIVYNPVNNDQGQGFFVANTFVTNRHVASDIKNEGPVSNTLFLNDEPVVVPKEAKADVNGDYCKFDPALKSGKPTSLKADVSLGKYTDYVGPGFVMYLEGDFRRPDTIKLCMSLGNIVKKGCMLFHDCPTVQGLSGAPILNREGFVVGYHKGWGCTMNIGRCIEDAMFEWVSENTHGNVNQGRVFNFDYLPRSCVPRLFDDPTLKTPWDGEDCTIYGFTPYKKTDYRKYEVSKVYMDTYLQYGLPDPVAAGWGVAKPNLESISMDHKKYTRWIDLDIDEECWKISATVMADHYAHFVPKHLKTIDLDEAISRMDGKKAPGYPAKLKYYTKEDFILKEKWSLIKFVLMIIKGEDPDVVFDIVGKEELRQMIKLLINKIRSFNSAGIHAVLIEKMLFQDLLDEFSSRNFFETNTTAGWSPYYGGWNEYIRYLSDHVDFLLSDVDIAKWDSSVQSRYIEEALDLLTPYIDFSPSYQVMYDWYIAHVIRETITVCPFMDMKEYLESKNKIEEASWPGVDGLWVAAFIGINRGVKSGQLITFFINCEINKRRNVYCMLRISKLGLGYETFFTDHTWDDVCKFMNSMTCGDDFNGGSRGGSTYTFEQYCSFSKELGFVIDSGKITTDLNEIQFAGLRNMHIGGYNVFVIDLQRLIFNLAVVKRSNTIAQYCQKLDNLIRASALAYPDLTHAIIKYRDALVKYFPSEEMSIVSPGFATFKEAAVMQFPVLESLVSNKNETPDKRTELCNNEGFIPNLNLNERVKLQRIADRTLERYRRFAGHITEIMEQRPRYKRNYKKKVDTELKHIDKTIDKIANQKKAGGRRKRTRANKRRVSSNKYIPKRVKEQLDNVIATGSTPEIQRALLAVCSPASAKNYRWGSGASEPTATASLIDMFDVDWDSGSTANRPLQPDENMLVLQRIPTCGVIKYFANTDGNLMNYKWSVMSQRGTDPVPAYTPFLSLVSNEPYPLKVITAVDNGGAYQPHGSVWYAASAGISGDARRWFWCNWNDTVVIKVQNTTGATTVFKLDTWTFTPDTGLNQLDQIVTGNILDNGYATLTATPASGLSGSKGTYVAFDLISTVSGDVVGTSAAGDPMIKISGTGYCFGHQAFSNIPNNAPTAGKMRIIGASAMYSNGASFTEVNGFVYGAQLSSATHWLDYVGDLTSLLDVTGVERKTAKQGIYGFLKPSDMATDMKMYSFLTATKTGVITDSCWPIKNDFEVLVLYAQVPVVGGRSAQWTVQFAAEFTTTNKFFVTDLPRQSTATTQRCFDSIQELTQFYENPSHMAKILKGIGHAFQVVTKGATKYGPHILKAIEKYGPMAAEGIRMLA